MMTLRMTSLKRCCSMSGSVLGSRVFLAQHSYQRTYSQQSQSHPRGIRQGTLFAILACTGLGATIYAVLEYYSAFTQWPESLRSDLRFATKAQRARDFTRAAEGYRRVLEGSLTLPDREYAGLGVSKSLVVTGLHISLAQVLELSERVRDAQVELSSALSYLLSIPHKSPSETHRCIALSVKLGDMSYKMRDTTAENYYEWALEEMFRVSRVEKERKEQVKREAPEKSDDNTQLSLMTHQLNLPKWVSVSDLGACLERLAAIYAEQGQAARAVPLYMQAITLLMPPQKFRAAQPPTSDKCRAALLMTNLSSVLTAHPSSRNLDTALQWANKAIDVVEHADGSDADKICNHTLAVGLFNIGVLNEMLKHPNEAVRHYDRAVKHSERHGLINAKLQSKEALRRVNSSV